METLPLKGFTLKPTERALVPQKMICDFKIALRLRDQHVFVRQSLEVLNVFNILTLKQVFIKTKTFVRNTEYRYF